MKINLKDRAKIKIALDRKQARCSARTVSVDFIVRMGQAAISQLSEMGVPRRKMTGATFKFYNRQKFPGSYRGQPYATDFVIEIGSKNIYLTDISRAEADYAHYQSLRFINEEKFRHLYKIDWYKPVELAIAA